MLTATLHTPGDRPGHSLLPLLLLAEDEAELLVLLEEEPQGLEVVEVRYLHILSIFIPMTLILTSLSLPQEPRGRPLLRGVHLQGLHAAHAPQALLPHTGEAPTSMLACLPGGMLPCPPVVGMLA